MVFIHAILEKITYEFCVKLNMTSANNCALLFSNDVWLVQHLVVLFALLLRGNVVGHLWKYSLNLMEMLVAIFPSLLVTVNFLFVIASLDALLLRRVAF